MKSVTALVLYAPSCYHYQLFYYFLRMEQEGCSPELDPGQIPIQHFQHLQMPNSSSMGGPVAEPNVDPRRPSRLASTFPFQSPTMATGSKGLYRQRCPTRDLEFCYSGRTGSLLPSNGHGTKEQNKNV